MLYWGPWTLTLLVVIFVMLKICSALDISICITTLRGTVLFVNRAFCHNYVEVSCGDEFLAKIKCDYSGYVELKRGKSGVVRCIRCGLLYFVMVDRHPTLSYVNFDPNGNVLKSKWPFISVGDNLFSYISSQKKLRASMDANRGNVMDLEINATNCTIGFLPGCEYLTIVDLSPVLHPGMIRLQTLGGMTAQVAHDFNNLLMGIMGFCEILGTRGTRTKELRGIENNTKQAAELVERILGWVKPGTLQWRRLVPYKSLVQMRPFLRCITGSKARIKINGTTKAAIQAPGSYFEQIVTNLVANARDAIVKNGVIEIDVYRAKCPNLQWVRGTVPAGEYLMLRVQDNGSGIPQNQASVIFQNSYSTKTHGTGQGLSIVADLLSEIGGFIINVPSEEGAVFELGFPLCAGVAEVELKEEPVQQTTTMRAGKILVVEDDESIRSLVASALKQVGHRVLVADNLLGGVERLKKYKPEIVISDSDLPDGDGVGFVELEEIYGHKTLIASGYSRHKLGIKCAFLQKPFTLVQLREKVAGMLDEKKK